MASNSPDDLVTRAEVAGMIRRSVRFLDSLVAHGSGPPVTRITPGTVLFRRGDVQAWIADFTDAPGKPARRPPIRLAASDERMAR